MIATILTALLTIVTAVVGTIAPQVFKFIVAKVGVTNLEKDLKIGKLIYDSLEEDGRLGELAENKLSSFIKAMKSKTKLSDSDILLLNKSIAGVANAGKAVVVADLASVVTPVEEIIPAPITYVDETGNELVQKVVASDKTPTPVTSNLH